MSSRFKSSGPHSNASESAQVATRPSRRIQIPDGMRLRSRGVCLMVLLPGTLRSPPFVPHTSIPFIGAMTILPSNSCWSVERKLTPWIFARMRENSTPTLCQVEGFESESSEAHDECSRNFSPSSWRECRLQTTPFIIKLVFMSGVFSSYKPQVSG